MKKTLKLSGKMIAIPIDPVTRQCAHDPDALPWIDDRMLENPNERLGVIYLKAYPTPACDDLVFIAERVIYVDEKSGNKTLGVETFGAAEFSQWFAKRKAEGWTLAS